MFIQQLQYHFQYPFTEDQQQLAVKLCEFLFNSPHTNILIIDGYAGTGKTGMVSALVKTLPAYNIKTILLAPTGRAAKLLSRYSQKPASTIHKHIYYASADKEGNINLKLKQNKNTQTLYIVDEASMIGESERLFDTNSLLSDLITHCNNKQGNKIIFVGDTAQLPPIGSPCSPALDKDYLNSHFNQPTAYHHLRQVVRQALQSGIVKNASNIRWSLANNRIKLPIFKTANQQEDSKVEAFDLEDTLRSEYRQNGVNEVLIITRTNKLANQINQYIRTRILEKENLIDIGETIMSVKNNYHWTDQAALSDFIANGDMLQITRIFSYEDIYDMKFADIAVKFIDSPEQHEIELTIILDTLSDNQASLSEDKQRSLYNSLYNHYSQYSSDKAVIRQMIKQDKHYNALQVKFSNALTCHKAQGGDWHTVFIQQGYFSQDMLTPDYFRWLYTAVTRAKQKLYLVNFSDDFFLQE